MSDFLYSSRRQEPGDLAAALGTIRMHDAPPVREFHGPWGSLAVSENMYPAFQVLEDAGHICCVAGGPVLLFDGDVPPGDDASTAGTRRLRDRFLSGNLRFETDLSGPFAMLLIDKTRGRIVVATDLMLFIPVYEYTGSDGMMLSTHIDVLARASRQTDAVDCVSFTDFVLNDVVTFPYTMYARIRQCPPASVLGHAVEDGACRRTEAAEYWRPVEEKRFGGLDAAASAVRDAMVEYVERVVSGMDHVAHFLSAGEDSRAIAGLLPEGLRRDAYVFVEQHNREARISEQVARGYGANLSVHFRPVSYYADILPEASRLVGQGHQYCHAHSLGFVEECGLRRYDAVFGGFLSDSFLKGYYTRKVRRLSRMHFLPEFFIKGETRTREISHPAFDPKLTRAVTERRREHFRIVLAMRGPTAHEWFTLWPATMRATVPNIYVNRRMFRSYEPFLASGVIRAGAAVPIGWKLNRRLFNRAMKPFLKKSRFIMHSDGRFPYYSWATNIIPRQAISWYRKFARKAGIIKGNQSAWTNWKTLVNSEKWNFMYAENRKYSEYVRDCISCAGGKDFNYESLGVDQKMNYVQTLVRLGQIAGTRDGVQGDR